MKTHVFFCLMVVCCICISLPSKLLAQNTLNGFPPTKLNATDAPYSIFISSGDNLWTANSLPIDSKAAIEASFNLLKAMGTRRIYWRGLEMAVLMEDAHKRPENARYYECWKWLDQIYKTIDIDRFAVETAHKKGMEIWGLGNWAEGYGAADTPPVWDYPFCAESKLRLNHPEWIPVDRHGVLKQAGPIDFSYPEARKALIDLHMKYIKRDNYDGVMFFSYAENHSMRFQDEFGFNEPVVKEFKRRYGVDLRTQDFTRSASRLDWAQLRGEYLTAFYREMKDELKKNNLPLGVMLDPHDLHYTQPWNQPELMQTAGTIYQDLEAWIRDGIVDVMAVYGSASGTLQNKGIDDMLWMTRGTATRVALFSSGPPHSRWKSYVDKGVAVINNFNEEEMFLDRSAIPAQTLASLKSGQEIQRLKVLSQIINGQLSGAIVDDLSPLTKDKNLLIRRMALKALGLTKDPKAVPIIEQGLEDPENAVRCIAALALGYNYGPESAQKLMATVERYGTHQLNEIAVNTLRKFTSSAIRTEMVKAYNTSKNSMVRATALRVMEKISTEADIPVLVKALDDTDQLVRLAAATALGFILNSRKAAQVLITATLHSDPVVSDRAATSMSIIIACKEPELASLIAPIREALRELYAKLGDRCTRADVDWGYRPVGNALLAMGPDGEADLRNFMLQTSDRHLAESAWKTLYIRQKPFSYSEITKKENDEAFKMRPAFLNEGSGVNIK
jgi:HEAT repeat protein